MKEKRIFCDKCGAGELVLIHETTDSKGRTKLICRCNKCNHIKEF